MVREAFGLQDEYNGGFVKRSMTADNMFILNSLIQRQILNGETLMVCFVDFSKAFDLISRYSLFYKLIKYGMHGRMIDTMRILYSKTHFRVKCNGQISYPVFDVSGVNQGGSGLFRRYLADLSEYLSCSVGVCLEEEIIVHLLWADDLLIISDTMEGIQKQLDGLAIYCAKHLMTLNETKTKLLVFGKDKFHNTTHTVTFNDKQIERTQMYKYLGNIFSETRTIRGGVFKYTYDYLCVKSQRALFSLNKQLSRLRTLPPKLPLHLFKTNIEPILTYGTAKAVPMKLINFVLFFVFLNQSWESNLLPALLQCTENWAFSLQVSLHIPKSYAFTNDYVTCHPLNWLDELLKVKYRCIINDLAHG